MSDAESGQGRSRKRSLAIALGLIVLGIAALSAGDRLEMQWLLDVGIALFGGAFLAAGVDAFVTRRVSFPFGSTGSTTYLGFSAICWGVVFTEYGLVGVAMAAVHFLGAEPAAIDLFRERPGVLFIAVGLMFACFGSVALFDRQTGPRNIFTSVVGTCVRLFALIPVFLGIALIAIGAVEIVAPAVFDGWVASLGQLL